MNYTRLWRRLAYGCIALVFGIGVVAALTRLPEAMVQRVIWMVAVVEILVIAYFVGFVIDERRREGRGDW